MTNDELMEALRTLLQHYEQMEDSRLRSLVYVQTERLLEELRDRAVGLSHRGQES
jgi:hypothetical protein